MVNKDYFDENKNIEFKREIPSNHEKFLKDIIAFSNSTGGQVIFGGEDETGCQLAACFSLDYSSST